MTELMLAWVSHTALRAAFIAAGIAATAGCSVDGRTVRTESESASETAVAGLDGAGALALGVACNQDTQCLSGACTDGVCCDAICDDACAACNSPGSLGRCTAIGSECDVVDVNGSGAAGRRAAPTPSAPDGRECNDGDTIDCATLQGAIGACAAAVAGCSGGRWSRGACEPRSAELCDAAFEDENCNGQTNESPPCETFRTISGGVNYLCGISTGGRVLCWGKNDVGQLGDGSLIDRDVPTEVVGLGTDIRSVVTSWSTTCAVSNAGNVSCWGDRLHWVRGGTSGASLTPVPATLFPSVLALVIEGARVCAILPDQTLACSATDPLSPGAGVVGIAPVPGFEGIRWFGKGDPGWCGVLADGTVRCTSGTLSAMQVAVPGLTGAVDVAGDTRAACAVVADGSVRCWGAVTGYLGLEQAADPDPLALVTIPGVSGAVAVSASVTNGCALTSGGSVQCWGFGDASEYARIAAMQDVDLMAMPLTSDRVFVRTASGEVFGFSPVNRGPRPMNGNPNADIGPYRLLGP
ncbi:MAG TPA: hypothetical protein VJU61_26845 [Polyangiaceae bacterium]|nr:hypothetical protein [Polyangiaceae bacterium]